MGNTQGDDIQIVFSHGGNNPSYSINVYYSMIEGGPSSISYSGSGDNNGSLNWNSGALNSYPYFNHPENGDFSLSTILHLLVQGKVLFRLALIHSLLSLPML